MSRPLRKEVSELQEVVQRLERMLVMSGIPDPLAIQFWPFDGEDERHVDARCRLAYGKSVAEIEALGHTVVALGQYTGTPEPAVAVDGPPAPRPLSDLEKMGQFGPIPDRPATISPDPIATPTPRSEPVPDPQIEEPADALAESLLRHVCDIAAIREQRRQ